MSLYEVYEKQLEGKSFLDLLDEQSSTLRRLMEVEHYDDNPFKCSLCKNLRLRLKVIMDQIDKAIPGGIKNENET